MRYREEYFETSDGLSLHHARWSPDSEPRAVVAIVHGLNEHVGRYAETAAALVEQGYCVHALDLRGHGKSQGPRAFVDCFDTYVDDLELFLTQVRLAEPDRPLFVLGHSMGGLIVTRWATTREANVEGLILSGPALRIGATVFPVIRRLAVLIGRLFPKLRIVKLGATGLSRDPDVVADFRQDPLVFHGRLPTGTGAEILRMADCIEGHFDSIELPLLILHGGADRVTDAEGSRRLYALAASNEKTLRIYNDLYHDLLHEPERERVTADILTWLDSRAGDG